MRFFRRRSSLGFLALLAVAMQAVLAFAETHAHSHAQAVRASSRCGPSLSAPAPRAPSTLALLQLHTTTRQLSGLRAVNLATAAILNQPPVVLTPPARFPAPAPVRVVHAVGGDDSVHFQARAPPALLMS